jgi:hypothetical protein
MPANVLPNYSFERNVGRFRSSASGRFVARRDILGLMERQIATSENRLADLTTALHEKRISPAIWQEQMRTELRRLHTTNAALGAGGFDRLTAKEWGRTGGLLRSDYQRLTNLANDIVAGKASLPQALQRVHGYIGNARVNFFEAEREAQKTAARESGEVLVMIRDLGASEHCSSCVDYHMLGWQPDLPSPGTQSECLSNCRCGLRYRTVTPSQAAELIGTRG